MEIRPLAHKGDFSERTARGRTAVLFFKPAHQASECARKNLAQTEGEGEVLGVDVSAVRDIHPLVGVTSVPTLVILEDGKVKNIVKGCQSPAYYKKIISGEGASVRRADGKPQKRVTVYTTPTCPYCNKLKQYLNKHGIRYTDINVAADQRAAQEMVRKSGQRGVPQTDINGQIVIGFDVPKISRLLDIPTE
ncbi:MAG: hypothetical protein GXO27_05515 [Chlorobi bacterium]|nr:hypothetical protein [Chlorobiota bacterium]